MKKGDLSDFKCSSVLGTKVLQKLLIHWDLPTQPSMGFIENGLKKTKMSNEQHFLGENVLMPEVRWEWPKSFKLMKTAWKHGSVSPRINSSGCWWWYNDVFLTHFRPLTTWASFKCHSLPGCCCWPCPSLYDHSVAICWWVLPAG